MAMIGASEIKKTNVKNGKWKEFNKHAVLVAEGTYLNYQKHGVWREYYDTGEIMILEHYHHGVAHGPFTSYRPGEKVFSQGNYHNGSREGYFTLYDEAGNMSRKLLFINNHQIEDIELHEHHHATTQRRIEG
jgi:antitoxin component YwqK of YwqJK toxin-antitoxin module